MKRLSLTCLLIACLAYSFPSNAQFFKKLKNKVSKAVSSVSEDLDTPVSSGSSAVAGHPNKEVKGTTADLSDFNPYTLYSLQPGEMFDFSESCLLIHADIASPQIIIKKGYKRYKIAEGGKHILVTSKNVEGCVLNGDDVNDHRLTNLGNAAGSAEILSPGSGLKQYVRMSVMGANGAGSYIDFNNKNYGPYGMVSSMILNKEKNKFKAVVMLQIGDDGTMRFIIIGSDGVKTKLPYTYMCHFMNSNYDYPLIIGINQNDINHKVIYDPQKKQSIKLIHDAGDIEVDRYSGALIYAGNGKIFIDEKLVKTFKPDIQVIPEHVYVGKDHSHWAVWTTDGLTFYDHTVIDGVLSCKTEMKNGKEMLSWIVLGKDNKTLFLCHAVL